MEKSGKMKKAKSLIKEVSELPTIPVVATQVLDLLGKPDVELEEVAEMILTDQVLAARVVKIVNSPLYRPSHEITSVKRALIYLGFRHIRELILTCSFITAFEGKDGVLPIKAFWEHSFGVGIVSRIIAQRIRFPDTEKAYLAGVVHDIGQVFLGHYLSDEYGKIIEAVENEPRTLLDMENERLGTTHCEVGMCLARKWNFPADYCDVIQHHHDPSEAGADPTLSAIVNLADLFCSVRGLDSRDTSWTSFSLWEEPAWNLLRESSSRLAGLDVERFCFELDDRVEEISDLVQSIFQKVTE